MWRFEKISSHFLKKKPPLAFSRQITNCSYRSWHLTIMSCCVLPFLTCLRSTFRLKPRKKKATWGPSRACVQASAKIVKENIYLFIVWTRRRLSYKNKARGKILIHFCADRWGDWVFWLDRTGHPNLRDRSCLTRLNPDMSTLLNSSNSV